MLNPPTHDAAGAPSPYCGRVDDHGPHPWSRGPTGPSYDCPGAPLRTRAERLQATS
jgi:hypothetical protein